MKPNDLPPRLIGMLADIFELGCKHNCRSDTVALLKLLIHVRPDVSALALVSAWNLIELKEFAAARELLEATEAMHPSDPMTKAMLVMCLYLQGDSLWHARATEIRGMEPDAQALAVVEAIEEVANDAPVGRAARLYA